MQEHFTGQSENNLEACLLWISGIDAFDQSRYFARNISPIRINEYVISHQWSQVNTIWPKLKDTAKRKRYRWSESDRD